MRRTAAILLALCGAAMSQEPANFNVTDALSQKGVNVSSIPSLASLQQRSTTAACSAACGALNFLFSSNSVLAQNTAAYQNASEQYWSVQQEEAQPFCYFEPENTFDVSILVLLSRFTGCPFAVKSGGHAAFTGASNIPGGITVWLKNFNEVILSEDKSVAAVGAGNTWLAAYEALESEGLAVIGGRVSSIGVGGLTLGGGISYYSNLVGWACDNVQSYEVVTAWGEVVMASVDENPDLYWALRGGGNNFGIVTTFNLYTIESPEMWGGEVVYLENEFPGVIDAFIHYMYNCSVDGDAQLYIAFVQEAGLNLASAELTYVRNVSFPPIFEPFKNLTAISDDTKPRTLVQYVNHIQESNPDGLREVYWPHTFLLNEEFATWALNHWFTVLPQVANVTGGLPALIYQGITVPMINNMTKYNGNALGLNPSQGPLHLMHVSFWWEDSSDDATVYTFLTNWWNDVTEKAKSMGVYHDYIYMNYASLFQDVVANYGSANQQRLQDIAAQYDPSGVFEILQPGYFKLHGAPYQNPY